MAAPAQPQANPFELARKRAAQQEGANLQGQKDAIARRAAQLGGGPSGAMIKQEGLVADASAKRLNDVNEGINAQEQQEQARIREIREGREFQTSERVGSQQWQGSQNEKALGLQKYGIDTSATSQKYAVDTGATSQKYAVDTSADVQREGLGIQREGQVLQNEQFHAQLKHEASESAKALGAQLEMQKKAIAEAAAARTMSDEQVKAALEQANNQYKSDLAENIKTNYINSIISAHNSGMDPGVMKSMIADLGVTFDATTGLPIVQPKNTGLAAPGGAVPLAGTDTMNPLLGGGLGF